MSAITEAFENVYRDSVTKGVASSGAHKPLKSEIREIGPLIDQAIANITIGGTIDVTYATRAELEADLAFNQNSVGLVYSDPTGANNDFYTKSGASGAGSWSLTTILHDAVEVAAEEQVELAQAWAEGTEPGGVGTKSAKQHAQELDDRYAVDDELSSFSLIGRDADGNVFQTLERELDGQKGAHKMHAPLSFDSIDGFSEEEVEGISYIVIDDANEVIAYSFDNGKFVWVVPQSEAATNFIKHKSLNFPRENIGDGMWSWWIASIAAEMGQERFITSLTSSNDAEDGPGLLSIAQSSFGSDWQRTFFGEELFVFGDNRVDDHDVPCILLDPRPDAAYPIEVYQTHHALSEGKIRNWRSPTIDGANLGDANDIAGAAPWTYGQAWRRQDQPDHIYHLLRKSGSGGGEWVLRRSTDNGESWPQEVKLFELAQLYTLMIPSIDRDGLHLVSYLNPSSDDPSEVAYCFLEWDGRLTAPIAGVISNNVWADFSAIDPIASGDVVHTPASGFELRLMDVRQFNSGEIDLCWSEFDFSGPGGQASGNYAYAKFSTATGATTIKGDVSGCGEGVDSDDYIAGAIIIDEYEIIAARWNLTPGAGGQLVHLSGSDLTASNWTLNEIEASADKIIRPTISVRSSWDAVNQRITYSLGDTYFYLKGRSEAPGDGWLSFYRYGCDVIVKSKGDLS